MLRRNFTREQTKIISHKPTCWCNDRNSGHPQGTKEQSPSWHSRRYQIHGRCFYRHRCRDHLEWYPVCVCVLNKNIGNVFHDPQRTGAESLGLVAPSITRPVLTTLSPSHTIATTGPMDMYLMRPGKKPLLFRSA